MKKELITYALMFAITQAATDKVAEDRDIVIDKNKRDVVITNKFMSKVTSIKEGK